MYGKIKKALVFIKGYNKLVENSIFGWLFHLNAFLKFKFKSGRSENQGSLVGAP
jgi:hypothetical protein